jgi:hypothetical protein
MNENAGTDSNTGFTERQARTFAPWAHWYELNAQVFERSARYAQAVAGDVVDFGIGQINAACSARDIPTMLSRQADVTRQFAEQQAKRLKEWSEIAANARDEYTSVAKEAAREIRENTDELTKAARKPTEEAAQRHQH